MEKITLSLETVTAAFVHAEQDEARWRAAPFRGLARWWFRAITGAALPAEQVRRREAELFGTSERASAVAFRVLRRVGPAPTLRKVNPGSQYGGSRMAFPERSAIDLVLQSNPWAPSPEKQVAEAYAAVWVALHLGGIGQRARRGAGSLRVVDVKPEATLPAPAQDLDAARLAEQLALGIRTVRQVLGTSKIRPMPAWPTYPVLHPDHAEVWVATMPWGPGEEQIRLAIMNLRRECHRDGPLHGGRRFEPEFGAIGNTRIASPFWIRVASSQEGRSTVVATLLRHEAAVALKADWTRVERFIQQLNGTRVDLG